VAQFRLSGAAAQGEVGITSDSGKFFGILLQPVNGKTEARLGYNLGSTMQTGALLIDGDHFKLDRWYVVTLSVDNDRGFQVRLWQLDDPTVHGEASLGGFPADSWRFRQRVNKGTLWLDDYFEGVVYRETETQYVSETKFDTIPGIDPPDLAYLLAYKDLAVVWSYPVETISRTFGSGDTDWTGTRMTYQYEPGDQHFLENGNYADKQYGNLTRTVTSVWNGTAWTPLRATKSEFWMRDSGGVYLVSLPGKTIQLDCSSACNFITATPLLGESLYIYEGSDTYSSAPTSGRLSIQRDLVNGSGTQKRYSETAYTYDTYGNVLTQKAYIGYAAENSPPVSGTQLITTTYDGVYHTYPLSQANALNQAVSTSYDYALGQPVSETDANGAVTTASYDALGRITALVRPGDDAANPTMRFSYHIDSATHLFWTEALVCRGSADLSLSPACDGTYTKVRKYYNGLGQLLQTQTDAEISGTLKTVVTNVYYDSLGRVSKEAVPFSVALTNGSFASRPASPSIYTQTSYDLLGRVIEVRAPDGTTRTSIYSIQREAHGFRNIWLIPSENYGFDERRPGLWYVRV
jgi:YD repeat-containing protein